MNIYLIRHGRQNSPLCNVNVELSKEGYRQAELLGKRLESYQIDVVYSSHLTRAIQTAEVLNRYLKQQHYIREQIREISFGDLEGHTDEYINTHFGNFKTEQMKLSYDIPYPGGECGLDVYKRAMETLNEIIRSNKNDIAVVTHGGVIRALLAGILGLDMSKKLLFGVSLENCSITQFIYDKNLERFYLERFNDYAHLEADPSLLRKYFK